MRNKGRMAGCFFIMLMGLVLVKLPVRAAAFDAAFYAETYPDVAAVFGTNPDALLNHYLTFGIAEKRYPCQGAEPGMTLEELAAASISAESAEPKFEAQYYAAANPDVVKALGTDASTLLKHYLTFGINEGRKPYAGAEPGAAVDGIAQELWYVPMDQLANLKSLRKKATDSELSEAYVRALDIVAPLKDLPRKEQAYKITAALSKIYNEEITYSMTEPHYNDPYGFFIIGTASCAGCSRAEGLCLNILGIPYEHVNENQYTHQWCRIEIDGEYWVCDANAPFFGKEWEPYRHPWISY